ncbi:MAG: Ig-like domain-containing protein [Paludibacter sp.]|nr:Ig-like domain-containing protein [Paludibacter sp.]
MRPLFYGLFFVLFLLFSCNTINNPVDSVKTNIDSTTITISVEDSITLSINKSIDTIQNKDYNWKSLATNIASVSRYGVVKGIASGKTKIVITSNDGKHESDTCVVVVLTPGTATNPYKIRTIEDLKKMRDRINNQNARYANKYYQLINNLDLSNESAWYPIGINEYISFSGQFDGNNKVISGLKLSDSADVNFVGFFGSVRIGKILNLGVVSSTISGKKEVVGGIVGLMVGGSIVNCYHRGNLGGVYFVGGLVGEALSLTISQSYSDGEILCAIIAGTEAGGLVGTMDFSTISDSYSKGKVVSYYCSGGIAGSCSNGSITNSYSESEIISNQRGSDLSLAGGIAGVGFQTLINQCYNKGNVIAYTGIAGGITANYGSLYNCYSVGNVSSIVTLSDSEYPTYATAGGIIGRNGTAYNCYSTGRIYAYGHANSYCGGIAGSADIVNNCYSSSRVYTLVTGSSVYGELAFAGGIAGNCPQINNCIAMNDSITAISQYQNSYSCRIVAEYNSNNSAQFSANYAKSAIKLFDGVSWSSKKIVTDYSNYNKFGSILTGDVLNLLNNYVTLNSTVNNITLKNWAIISGTNNGLPIFK